MKIVIASESQEPEHPYKHLQPIVDFLAARGNEIATDPTGFYLTQGGWICDFRNPIDYTSVSEAFLLPPTVRFGKKTNTILCDKSWAEIRGGVGPAGLR